MFRDTGFNTLVMNGILGFLLVRPYVLLGCGWKEVLSAWRRNDWSQFPRIPESLFLLALGDCGFTLGFQPVAFRWLKGK